MKKILSSLLIFISCFIGMSKVIAGERILVISNTSGDAHNWEQDAFEYLEQVAVAEGFELYDLDGNLIPVDGTPSLLGSTIDDNMLLLTSDQQLIGYDVVLVLSHADIPAAQLTTLQSGIDKLFSKAFVMVIDTYTGATGADATMNSMLSWMQPRLDVAPPGVMQTVGGDLSKVYNLSLANDTFDDAAPLPTFQTYLSTDVANIPPANILYQDQVDPSLSSAFYFPADASVGNVGTLSSCLIMSADISAFGQNAGALTPALLDVQVPSMYDNLLFAATDPTSVCRLPVSDIEYTGDARIAQNIPYHPDMATVPTVSFDLTKITNLQTSQDPSRWVVLNDTLSEGLKYTSADNFVATNDVNTDTSLSTCTQGTSGIDPDPILDTVQCPVGNVDITEDIALSVNATLDTTYLNAQTVLPVLTNQAKFVTSSIDTGGEVIVDDTVNIVPVSGDLSTSASFSPTSAVYTGEALDVAVTLSTINNSTNAVYNPSSSFTLPPNATIGVVPTGCTLSAGVLTCVTAGELAGGVSSDFMFTLTFPANNWMPTGPTWTESVTITPQAAFVADNDNPIYINEDIGPTADSTATFNLTAASVPLNITTATTPADTTAIVYDANPYISTIYEATVQNAGTIDLTDVITTITIPTNATIATLPANCDDTNLPTLTCAIASLPAGVSEAINLPLSFALTPDSATWASTEPFAVSADTGSTFIFDTTNAMIANNYTFVAQKADLQVSEELEFIPDTPLGEPEQANFKVIASNAGPSDIDSAFVEVTIPNNVVVADFPPECTSQTDKIYICDVSTSIVSAGSTKELLFLIENTEIEGETTGTIMTDIYIGTTGSSLVFDPNTNSTNINANGSASSILSTNITWRGTVSLLIKPVPVNGLIIYLIGLLGLLGFAIQYRRQK